MFGIVFLLVISIAYAGVLEYYGKIVGTANVLPPTFYAHSEKEIYDKTYRVYKANVQPDGPLEENFAGIIYGEAGEYPALIDVGWLIPQVPSFYPSSWKFYYEVKIENANKGKLFTKIYKFDTTTGTKTLIKECPTSDYTTSTEYGTISSTCDFPGISQLTSSERILVEYWAWIDVNASTLGKIYLKVDDPISPNSTRVEVSKS
jgi:hypothetical protein